MTNAQQTHTPSDEWLAEQEAKRQAASARFIAYRASVGMPIYRSPTSRVAGDGYGRDKVE